VEHNNKIKPLPQLFHEKVTTLKLEIANGYRWSLMVFSFQGLFKLLVDAMKTFPDEQDLNVSRFYRPILNAILTTASRKMLHSVCCTLLKRRRV